MNITLNKNEFEFIIKKIESLPGELNYEKNNEFDVTIKAHKEIIEKLLDKISDILADKGFDENDNLTPVGVRLEKIIDSISNVFYE